MSNPWQQSGSRWEPAPGKGAPPSMNSVMPAVPVGDQRKPDTDRRPPRRSPRSAAVLAAVVAMITLGLIATWTVLAPAVGDLVAHPTGPAPSAERSGRPAPRAQDDRTGDDHRRDDHRRSDDEDQPS